MDDITTDRTVPVTSAPVIASPAISATTAAILTTPAPTPPVAAPAPTPEVPAGRDRRVAGRGFSSLPVDLGRGFAVGIGYVPARGHRAIDGGGDWTTTYTTRTTRTLVIGDVAGHGPGVAAQSGAARTLLAARLRRHDSPATALSGFDHDWHTAAEPQRTGNRTATPPHHPTGVSAVVPDMITACVVTATPLRLPHDPADPGEPADRQPTTWWQLRWSNAGHPHPLLIAPTGIVTTLTCGPNDLPLGVDPTRLRTDYTATVPDGSTLLLFTDGLTEHRQHTTGHQQLARVASALTTHLATDLATDLSGDVSGRHRNAAHPPSGARVQHHDPAVLVRRIIAALGPRLDTDEATLLAARLHTGSITTPAPPPRRAGTPAQVQRPISGEPTAFTSTRYHLRAA